MAKNKFKGGTKKKGMKTFNKKNFKGKQFSKKNKIQFDVNARLVIRNLSFKTTEETLKQHFEPFGKIVQVNIPKRPNGDIVGCGFVQFENSDHAKQGMDNRNGQSFLGRSLQIDFALPKNEFVKNKKLEEHVEIKSEIKSESDDDEKNDSPVKKEPDFNKKPKFKNREDNQDEESQDKKNRIKRKARLIVRNIPFKATEETLKKHFEPYGKILEVVLLKKSNGDLVGCGFIQFENVQNATKAMIKTNAKPFIGRPIHVDWAVPKCKYMSYITEKKDEEERLKDDVKSEPESDESDAEVKVENNLDVQVKSESEDDEEDDEEESDDEESGSENDKEVKDIIDDPSKKVSANDAEDGRTVFLKNISFSVTSEDLEEFMKGFGEVNYALVCVDKLTEHSKGTGFVRFKNKEDADIFLSSGPDKMLLQGQSIEPLPALFRERAKNKINKANKQPKDARNLYLIKEGLILANSKAAVGVSTTDMAKRLDLEQKKSQQLRNLNRFISRYRLTIHNIPERYTDIDLKNTVIQMANVKPYALKECRIMKHLKGPLGLDGKHASKGYGFVMFTKHEDAITCLRRMNNNPTVFDKNNRPIVSFSIEDKAVINARKKRLEKSKIKNPLHKNYRDETKEENGVQNKNDFRKNRPNNLKRKSDDNETGNNSNQAKKSKKNKQKPIKNPADKQSDDNQFSNDYAGEVGKPGAPQKMRNRYKLKMQANIHKENVKQLKKQQKSTNKNLKKGIKEKIKQPKQKMNTSGRKKLKNVSEQRNEKSFTDLISKYKSKLVGVSTENKVKSKWYDKS